VSPERVKVDRQVMPSLEAVQRINSFDEVALGYSEEQAELEASRCLNCKKPLCIEGCPVEINIPAFINFIKERKYADAIRTIKEKNNLPAICGRVCPQENQCEKRCVLGKKHQPVAIGNLERFVADWDMKQEGNTEPVQVSPSGKKVAIVGSGPAGLTAAADLARLGHQVTVLKPCILRAEFWYMVFPSSGCLKLLWKEK